VSDKKARIVATHPPDPTYDELREENERLRTLEDIVREHYADRELGYLLQEWLSRNWQR